MGTLTQLLDDPACAGNTTLQLITGMVYAHDNNHIEALRCCHQASTLEMYGAATCSMLCVVPCELFMFATLCECGKSHRMALAVQVLLAMNRPDQAEKQVKVPVGGSNNTLLKQGWQFLTRGTMRRQCRQWMTMPPLPSSLLHGSTWHWYGTGWCFLADTRYNTSQQQGGAKVQEALYIYQELGERFNWTVRLHNGAAVALMKMGSFEDAEQQLLEAYDKNPKDPDTLANLYVCGLHLSKNVARYLTYVGQRMLMQCVHCCCVVHRQLKTSAASHPFVKRMEVADRAYDMAAAAGF